MKKISKIILIFSLILFPVFAGAISIIPNPVILGDNFTPDCVNNWTYFVYIYNADNTSAFLQKNSCEHTFVSTDFGVGNYIVAESNTDWSNASLANLVSGGGYVGQSSFSISSPAPPLADTFSFITLPDTALADISQYIPTAFTSLWVVIAVVIGLPVAFWVIRKTIKLARFK